jgi:hypothetical protein
MSPRICQGKLVPYSCPVWNPYHRRASPPLPHCPSPPSPSPVCWARAWLLCRWSSARPPHPHSRRLCLGPCGHSPRALPPGPGRSGPVRPRDPVRLEARGDILFVFSWQLLVGGVSVIRLAAETYTARTTLRPRFAAAAQGSAKQHAYRWVSFAVPFGRAKDSLVESFGRLGATAMTLPRFLTDEPGLSWAVFISRAQRELSFVFGNAPLRWSGLYAAMASGRTPLRRLARMRRFSPVGCGCVLLSPCCTCLH